MEEKKLTRKKHIRNIAIVFFAALFLLTFFSNTIMNLTLPQVAVVKVKSGTIYHKVRGSGKAEAAGQYEVKLRHSQKIARLYVSEGDAVSENQLLLMCEAGEEEELKAAKETLANLQLEYQKTLLETGDAYGMSRITIQKAKDELAEAIEKKQKAQSGEEEIAGLKMAITQKEQELAKAKQNMEQAQEKLDNSADGADTASLEREIQTMERELAAAKVDLGDLNQDLETALLQENTDQITALRRQIRDKETEIAYKETDLKSKRKELKKAGKDSEKAADLTRAAQEAKQQYESRYADMEKEKERLANLESSVMTVEDADALIREKELALRVLLLEEKKQDLDFEHLEEQVDAQQSKVDALAGEEKEVRAPVSGVIRMLQIAAGDTASAEETLLVISMTGEGYRVSFPVTVEQSRYVSVGNEASVLNIWDEAVTAKLMGIKADPDDPDRSRILTFQIMGGEITQGQSLAVSVGDMQQSYDTIVPAGAVFYDNQGSFVYVLHIKSTPLGNRYLAERKAVEVLAADDDNAAILGDLGMDDYVITQSMEPIENGAKVRLSD